MIRNIAVTGFILLAACGQQDEPDRSTEGQSAAAVAATKADLVKAVELMPADAPLAAKYDRSCRSCHATPDAAAPLTGHKAGWDARFAAKGNDGLLASVKTGLNAMPSMGLCNDCSDEELMQLTSFMAGRNN